jgi:hypothetical protein
MLYRVGSMESKYILFCFILFCSEKFYRAPNAHYITANLIVGLCCKFLDAYTELAAISTENLAVAFVFWIPQISVPLIYFCKS